MKHLLTTVILSLLTSAVATADAKPLKAPRAERKIELGLLHPTTLPLPAVSWPAVAVTPDGRFVAAPLNTWCASSVVDIASEGETPEWAARFDRENLRLLKVIWQRQKTPHDESLNRRGGWARDLKSTSLTAAG